MLVMSAATATQDTSNLTAATTSTYPWTADGSWNIAGTICLWPGYGPDYEPIKKKKKHRSYVERKLKKLGR